jgi:hypothetical protein
MLYLVSVQSGFEDGTSRPVMMIGNDNILSKSGAFAGCTVI